MLKSNLKYINFIKNVFRNIIFESRDDFNQDTFLIHFTCRAVIDSADYQAATKKKYKFLEDKLASLHVNILNKDVA